MVSPENPCKLPQQALCRYSVDIGVSTCTISIIPGPTIPLIINFVDSPGNSSVEGPEGSKRAPCMVNGAKKSTLFLLAAITIIRRGRKWLWLLV